MGTFIKIRYRILMSLQKRPVSIMDEGSWIIQQFRHKRSDSRSRCDIGTGDHMLCHGQEWNLCDGPNAMHFLPRQPSTTMTALSSIRPTFSQFIIPLFCFMFLAVYFHNVALRIVRGFRILSISTSFPFVMCRACLCLLKSFAHPVLCGWLCVIMYHEVDVQWWLIFVDIR